MDNLTQQVDEIEALVAIYDSDWIVEDEENRAYSITIKENNQSVTLYLKLPGDYPSSSPPIYELSAPHLTSGQKRHISQSLDEVYLSSVGQNVIFQWIEKIREELQVISVLPLSDTQTDDLKDKLIDSGPAPSITIEKYPIIHHGEVIVDRKSSFQGHAAQVSSIDEVKLVLKALMEIKKIAQATHNMYAYRISHEQTTHFLQDCEDDGETHAGSRLLHLLQIVNAQNIVVVVSRWYGNIHLGPNRFRHINNAARQVLEAANLISKNKNHKK